MTVARLLDEWMAARTELGASTRAEYDRIVEHRIKPYIGPVKLQELRPSHVAGMLEASR